MELTFRAATPAERLYTAGQSTQIAGQTGCTGHLRADMGEDGYYHTDKYGHDREAAQAIVDEYNGQLGVSKAQEAAMLAGSVFGWHVPGADPKNYDEQGHLIKHQHRNRKDAR